MSVQVAPLQHPGPANAQRFEALACRAHPVTLTLRAGLSLADAVTQTLGDAGFEAGYLRLGGLEFSRLDYVIPGPPPGDGRAAWYSETHRVSGATLLDAGLHLGLNEGAPFQHCHGVLRGGDGVSRMGHLLCPQSILASDAIVRGYGLSGAQLVVRPDEETGFNLFRPERTKQHREGGQQALLCTLRPNEDPLALLAEIAEGNGHANMQIEGIGSLVGTVFADFALDSYATEILLRKGHVAEGTAVLDVASIGLDGVMGEGPLRKRANRICITAEVLMLAG